jgi:hypothetical protein
VLSAWVQRKRRGRLDRALVVAAGATVAAYAGVGIAYFWRVAR